MTDDQIRQVFLANGFTIKAGQDDLKPYVYAAARALLEQAAKASIPDAKTLQFCGVDNSFAPYAGPIEPGMTFIWERDKPHARCVTTVTRVEGGMVWSWDDRFSQPPREVSNDESRFREACVPV